MYNSLSRLPNTLYNILTYLAQSDDQTIFKMLAYNDYDALSKPDLTFEEKMKLIWKTGPQEQYSIFLTPLIEDSITESKCVLKCYQYYIHPTDLFSSAVVFAFDFLYGGQMSLIDYEGTPVSRGDLFINKLLEILNGANVGGVGTMMFNEDLSRYIAAKATIGNSKTFTGVCVYLGTVMGDSGRNINCEE